MVRKANEGFSWRQRLVRTSDYRSIYNDGQKLHSQSFVLFRRENNLGHHRLGITVSRKIGNAVVRNRIKRLFREVFRKSSADIPRHFDFVLNAKRSCAAVSYSALREEFLAAARRAERSG